MVPDPENTGFILAADFINNTSQSLFLTGKAGSGKTTFLRFIKEYTSKNTVVVAPTGVAAINAGGVTIHSFFQLPPGNFLIESSEQQLPANFFNRNTLFKTLRISREKRELIEELELLIIDEISMVRCDLLDAVDTVLKSVRKKHDQPFGGVQLLFIGDLFQLPPVINEREWRILSNTYEGPYFFHSQVIKHKFPLYIELKKIYRQKEEVFIGLLNRVRNNNISEEDIQLLNSRYRSILNQHEQENYILLTTHNYKADQVNNTRLHALQGKIYEFPAEVQGEFGDHNAPADRILRLKQGAQVMFIKNDSGEERKYYNGKLGVIKSIADGKITVSFPEEGRDLILQQETWRNIRYNYDKEKDRIDEEALGTYKQYPIRLAWAVTIHKSQGLTFDKVIIDAGESFAPGQVYVALSRCTTLEGIILYSKIRDSNILNDLRIHAFANAESSLEELQQQLKSEKNQYWSMRLIDTFDFKKILEAIADFRSSLAGKKLPDEQAAISLCSTLTANAGLQQEIAMKFKNQLHKILIEAMKNSNNEPLKDRTAKAIIYFCDACLKELLQPIEQYLLSLKGKPKVRKHTKDVKNLSDSILKVMRRMQQAKFGEVAFVSSSNQLQSQSERISIAAKQIGMKAEKGSSIRESLKMFLDEKSIEEIARTRNLTIGTIESHLVSCIKTGELNLFRFLKANRIDAIMDLVQNGKELSLYSIKLKLPSDYSFNEIRAVLNHIEWMEKNKL
ncbi:MAG: helix-turn-helix domain-containing protein [Chitinophagales bacterium]|nr:helix-turn-helix domain-containing protein [Chitinophagales bacterium]